MTEIHIPATIEEAGVALAALDGLVTAKEWKRAAIVAAFVDTTTHGGDRTSKASSSLAPHEFAAFGIAGLRSKDTVRRYVTAWESTGLPRPVPGEKVEMPTDPWPPRYADDPGPGQEKQGAARSPGQVAKVLGQPEDRERVIAQMTPEAKAAIVRDLVADDPQVIVAAVKDDERAAKAIAADPAAHVAVARERNVLSDAQGVRDPKALDEERKRKRLENGPTLIEILEWSALADRATEIAGKFQTPISGHGEYRDDPRTIIETANMKITAAVQHVDDVVNGRVDTRIADDLSELLP